MAPEVIGKKYGEKCDLWSAGVALYYVLTGSMPFAATTEAGLNKIIKLGKFAFPKEPSLSPECKSLVCSLLTLSPEKRHSAADALDHPWFASTLLPSPAATLSFRNLTRYLKLDHTQKLVVAYIAAHTSDAELLKEMNAFLKINTSRSGVLSREEVLEWMAEKGVQTEDAFDELDVNRSKGVEYFGIGYSEG
eukprot:TRINITY_DN10347_c0_g1_i3.p1 TRINITY_DN10347_c0_g1~~TRINITY_DN10347_c0_g1_i3.p1  ORF type:complete len:192 (-),score=58.40 TRINITY_DN10347_c0_g1_i3:370-945(-)